jgi:hypothetical protein
MLLSAATAFILLCGGCIIGPKYAYTGQPDSPSIEGPVMPIQGAEYGSFSVIIMKIDGLGINFTASHVGMNLLIFDAKKPIPLAPGTHSLDLYLSDVQETTGSTGHGNIGVVGTFTAASHPTIVVDLLPKHLYRVGANLEDQDKEIEIHLWDETNGAAKRTSVGTWTVDSGGGYMEATLPSGGHR